MDKVLSSLIDNCWDYYVKYRDMQNSPIVSPSIPVFWFGDITKYQNESSKKVITLAINPSNDEFRLDKKDNYNFIRFKMGQEIYMKNNLNKLDKDVLFQTLNNYFMDMPYKWFNRMETPLNCIGSSYGEIIRSKKYSNHAIHIDLCPLSTKLKWGKISECIQEQLLIDFKDILNEFIKYLNPDIILSSLSEKSLDDYFNINAKEDCIKNFENKSGGFIRNYYHNGICLINGRNMRGTPFGAMTYDFIKNSLDNMEV